MEKSFKFYVGVFKIVLFEIKSQYEGHLLLLVVLGAKTGQKKSNSSIFYVGKMFRKWWLNHLDKIPMDPKKRQALENKLITSDSQNNDRFGCNKGSLSHSCI